MTKSDKLFASGACAFLIAVGVLCLFVMGRDEQVDLDPDSFSLDESAIADTTIARRDQRPLRPNKQVTPVAVQEEKKPVVVVAAGDGKIVGRVLSGSGEDALPLPEALVTSRLYFPGGELNFGLVAEHRAECRCDEDGQFEIKVPGHGAYRIEVTHPGYAPLSKDLVRAGAELTLNMKQGARMQGRVTALGQGKGVHGARLTLRRAKSTWSASVTTDEEGNYAFSGVPAETLYLTTEHPNFVSRQDEEVVLLAGEENERDLKLDPGKRIRGRVVNPQSVPVEAAVVRIDSRQTETDMMGEFEIGGLGAKSQNIQVIAEGFLTHHTNLNLSGSREEAKVDVTLQAGATVTGTVLDDTGKPLRDVEVKIFESWGGDYMWESGETRFLTHTDEDGRFEITGFAANGWGSYRARCRKDGLADSYSDEIKIKDTKRPKDIRIIMGAGGAISGKVIDRDGNPVAGAKLTLNPNNVYEWSSGSQKALRTMLSGEDGTYSFDKLAPRTYRISVIAPGHASLYKSNLKIVGASRLEGTDFTLNAGDTIIGTVKDEDGNPLAKAWVSINSKTSYGRSQTDEEGNYVIDNVAEGPYSAYATLDGFSRERKKDIYADAGRIDFELKKNGYVWGDVRDKATGEPVKTYQVELHRRNPQRNNAWRRASSRWINDPSGKFKLYAKDGSYKLVIRAKGYILLEKEGVNVSIADEPDEIALKVTPGGSIEGWVKDFQGMGMQGVSVYVRRAGAGAAKDAAFEERATSERDGYYFLDSLEAGTYEVAFFSWARVPLHIEPYVNVMGGDLKLLDMNVKTPPRLTISITNGKEKKISARVRLEEMDGRPIAMSYRGWRNGRNTQGTTHKRSLSARRGRAFAQDLPPGVYRATISYKGHETEVREFELREGENTDLDIILRKKGAKRSKAEAQ
jgi:protocatechuate 3,4-dioxygenase beta subunit